jgi:hypothetical protein
MAHVTINDQTPRVRYTVGSTPDSTFDVPFEFFALTDIKVYKGSTLLTYTTDYSVTGVGTATEGYETGEVTLVVAASNTVVTVFRDVPYERTTDFPLTGAFNITALNTQLDKLTAQVQQVKDQADRSLRIPVTDSTSLTTQLVAAATRAGNLLSFDSSGNVVATIGTTDVSTVAGISADVEAVSDIAANVTTVAGIAANVTTVAGISGNVTTVAGVSASVSTVAGVSANVTTVAGISADVTAVAADIANISAVADALPDIESLLNGAITSVTAANGSITVAGTATAPTISRAALTGDVTASAGSNSTTIAAGTVTYAKLQDVSATSRLIGRKTAGSGDAEEVTTSEALDFIGSTRGSLLYRGASGWAELTPGTSGQLLKSNGAGADPSYVTASAGAWEYVSAATASTSSTIDFQSFASGYDYLIAWDGLYTSGANQLLIRAEVSASWQASSYLSSLFYASSAGSDSSASGGGTAGVQAGYNMGATTAKPSSGEVLIVNPAQTTTPKLVLVSAAQIDNGSAGLRVFGSGVYTGSNAAVTGLRFVMSGGETFTAGNFILYRRARA